MIRIFCRGKHGRRRDLCEECSELLGYADWRLDRCPFGEHKPTCNHCAIHCYRADMKDRVKHVMRYSGPRMLLRHPWLSLRHMLDGFGEQPELPRRRSCPRDAAG